MINKWGIGGCCCGPPKLSIYPSTSFYGSSIYSPYAPPSPKGPCECCKAVVKVATLNFLDDAPCNNLPNLLQCTGLAFGWQALWSQMNASQIILFPQGSTCVQNGNFFSAQTSWIGQTVVAVRTLLCHKANGVQCECTATFRLTLTVGCQMSGPAGQEPTQSSVSASLQFQNLTPTTSVCSNFTASGPVQLNPVSVPPCGTWVFSRPNNFPVGTVTVSN